MISAATRLSAQPNTTAFGVCAAARLARCSIPWLGCCGVPATNRSLPSLSAFQAVTGVNELGMVDIVPPAGWRNVMTVSAAELLGWYHIARRDLPLRNPGVTAWQIRDSEFKQTPVAHRLAKFRNAEYWPPR